MINRWNWNFYTALFYEEKKSKSIETLEKKKIEGADGYQPWIAVVFFCNMLVKRPTGGLRSFLKKSITAVIILEAAGFIGSYALWYKANSDRGEWPWFIKLALSSSSTDFTRLNLTYIIAYNLRLSRVSLLLASKPTGCARLLLQERRDFGQWKQSSSTRPPILGIAGEENLSGNYNSCHYSRLLGICAESPALDGCWWKSLNQHQKK